ncbi:MAG: hypothetical protein IKY67_06405 [Paludibacteraceae bacterium]|nr:hypothetical protein [Paludibacteraceae bacterium]
MKLGIEKYERFMFTNQKNNNQIYYFSDNALLKIVLSANGRSGDVALSEVSLNWLLSKECKVVKVGGKYDPVRK